MKTLTDFEVAGKRVLVRCDFNVPLDDQGNVLDDFRIQKSLPTIEYLIRNKAKVILMTHLGDPDGKVNAAFKLDGVREKLQELLGEPAMKANDCIGEEVKAEVAGLKEGQVLLLENLRFHEGEKNNDIEFSKELAELGEMYINDAFACSHRAHASLVGVPQYLPHGAGLLLETEVKSLGRILQNPEKPFVALVGGTKVETKSGFLKKISGIADVVLVNGLIKKGLVNPPSNIIGPETDLNALDINNQTIEKFKEIISTAKTVIWNGPFGKFEDDQYKKGTLELAKAIVASGAFSVVGGGETIEFLRQEGMLDQFSHVSTGGGAMLDYLSDGQLPGLDALET